MHDKNRIGFEFSIVKLDQLTIRVITIVLTKESQSKTFFTLQNSYQSLELGNKRKDWNDSYIAWKTQKKNFHKGSCKENIFPDYKYCRIFRMSLQSKAT